MEEKGHGGETISLKWWLVAWVFVWIEATIGRGFGWREKGNRCCDLVIKEL